MIKKHQPVLILLMGLLYVYSICPFLCAIFEQKFCYDVSQEALSRNTGTHSTCCQSPKAAASGETETPSESGKLCCSTDLELVLPDNMHNTHESRELMAQSLVSILPISAASRIASRESLLTLPVPLPSTFFPSHSLSHRGPPFTLC